MDNQDIQTKAQLLAEIDKSWIALNSYLDSLSEAQMTTVRDDHEWTVKDHITHLVAWENSVVFFLQGKPRSEGLGVKEFLFENGTIDEVNEVVQQLRKDLSLSEAASQLQSAHSQLISLIKSLNDADLHQPLNSYHPAAAGNDRRKIIDLIRDNTTNHFSEHLGWIEAFVSDEG